MKAPSTVGESESILALLNGPAGAPPAGVRPNLDNPPNLNTASIAAIAVCEAFSALAVMIRLYTKLFLIRSTTYEDYALLVGWITYWANISAILYCIILCFIKISILLQYLRIFVPNRKGSMPLYMAIHVLTWSNFGFYLVSTIFEITMCSPRKKIWNPLMKTGHCYDANAVYVATGIFNVVSDFAILILPIIPISKLQMSSKRKIMMIAIFAAGGIACATSIVRTFYAFKIVQNQDNSYNILIITLWKGAEVTSGIIVSCLPITPIFFRYIGPKVYDVFSDIFPLSSKLRSTTDSESEPRHNQNQSNKVERALGKTEGKTLYNNQTRMKGEYITLSELDTAPVANDTTSGRLPASNDGGLMRRDDLESGRCAP
ncbi:MAG: hypothetical protein Q9195_009091 [Heterodermia aff. obscurata]